MGRPYTYTARGQELNSANDEQRRPCSSVPDNQADYKFRLILTQTL